MHTPKHKLGIAMRHMVRQGKTPCFRISGLRITMASNESSNPGSLYIKNDNWDYIGKVSPDGFMKIIHPKLITAEQKIQVMAAIHNPELTAMTNGVITGVCCCCGRQLTNPLSIKLGIGPICRGFWFPPVDTTEIELHDLETPIDTQICFKHPNVSVPGCSSCIQELSLLEEPLTSNLNLNLGAPHKPTPTIPEPVMALVRGYDKLNHTQRMICLDMLEEIESNASN